MKLQRRGLCIEPEPEQPLSSCWDLHPHPGPAKAAKQPAHRDGGKRLLRKERALLYPDID